jgi:hypothetical protein
MDSITTTTTANTDMTCIKFIDNLNASCKQLREENKDISDVELIEHVMEGTSDNLLATLIKDSNPPTILVRYSGHAENLTEDEEECRSLLIEYNSAENIFGLVFSQFSKIKSGEECVTALQKIIMDDSNTKISAEYCYDGTMITSIWSKEQNKFIHMTRSCVNAYDSYWQKISYGEMFDSAIKKNNIKFELNNFIEKDCHYFTVLVDYRNKNIIDYSSQFKDPQYSKVIFIAKRKNGTVIDLNVDSKQVIKNGFILSPQVTFTSVDNLIERVDEYDKINTDNKRIIHEGVIVKVYDNNNRYKVFKLKTDKFDAIKQILPNCSNVWGRYLDLYRKNKMRQYIEYYDIDKNILKIINSTFLNLVTELIKIYFKTRNNDNEELYNILPKSYHKALYDIHGLFIKKKSKNNDDNKSDEHVSENRENREDSELSASKTCLNNEPELCEEMIVKVATERTGITTYDINNYLRIADIDFVTSLINDRIYLIDNLPKQYYSQRIINVGCQDAYIMAKNINDDAEFIKLVNKYHRNSSRNMR